MKIKIAFHPKLMDCLRDYSASQFMADLTAGLTVGVVALPLAMAFAIASGVKPEAGIFTAVIAGFIISALGGSRVQIGGPTGAFVVIVYGILMKYGASNLAICTVMAGFMLLIMGISKMGSLIKFIPYPVIVGFTSGIAVLIFSTQIKDFFGLQIDKVPAEFIGKLKVLGEHFQTFQWTTLFVAIASILIIVLWPLKWRRWVPGSIAALIFGTSLVMIFQVPLETIGTRFSGVPQGLPKMQIPDFSFANIQSLVQPAITIALLAAIESLLSAVVADGMIDDRHDSNQELMAQGIANIVCPLFGGIAATGAIARTATNVKNGGRTPVSGIVHALTLLIILLVAAPLAKFIPLATLSAVLVVVAYNMGEWHHFARLMKWPKSDSAVFLTAFTLTVLIDLTVAVEVGMILAATLFIKRISETTQIMAVDENTETEGAHHSLIGKVVPNGVMVFRVFGAFCFGAADKLETALSRTQQEPKVLILRMRKVVVMDATGLNALEDLYEKLKKRGQYLILSGPHTQPYFLMEKAGFINELGRENICAHIDAALDRAREILGLPPAPSTDPAYSQKKELAVAPNESLQTLSGQEKHVG
jgi:SulP family sulfate permease